RPVVLLEGFFDTQELETFSAHGLQAVVHHESQLELLESTRLKRPISVWLKVDTGMHRLGFAPGAVKGVWQRLRRCASVGDDVRLMTHFAWADDPESPMTDRQARAFEEAVQDLPGERSLANSGAILGWPRTHADWVRPGIMLYGATPFLKGAGADHGLQPAMSLRTELIAVNRCRRGETVGYGGAWVCPEDMPVGVAAAGYGDGYPRHAEAGTPVLVGGRRVTLVGRVSMDMICLDLRGHAEAQVGEEVVLWGEGLPVETVAQHAGTIGYELLCRISPRVAYMETEQ
nr:alanine racemase [Gammaproteobacteria bacterium]NIR99004.1 alanine racemase [Gammaproteobacteria bacterium]NIT64633.1 alanine racemase [Gammaproteobacteria bacterium]NIV21606.1 alanine racemase [Gammaproteobacteria bacterium]NIX11317.1 alanine racemase [Gammaproteobacteria bacterium]